MFSFISTQNSIIIRIYKEHDFELINNKSNVIIQDFTLFKPVDVWK